VSSICFIVQVHILFNIHVVAIRIIRSATELGWITVALYTEGDTSHATFADEAVKLQSAADYMDVDVVVKAALTYVHKFTKLRHR